MRPTAVVGIILIILGVVAFAYGGFSFTTKEKVADLGPLKLEKESPWAGDIIATGRVAGVRHSIGRDRWTSPAAFLGLLPGTSPSSRIAPNNHRTAFRSAARRALVATRSTRQTAGSMTTP